MITAAIVALVVIAVVLATAVIVAPCILGGWFDEREEQLRQAEADELLSE